MTEDTPRSAKRGLKLGLTITFIATAIITYVAPEWSHVVAVVSASSNTVWLWEV